MSPYISVIVPVYNVETYLRKCIDSILSQSYKDFELLLINDGSVDRSGVICDEYALLDSRVRVFHKDNGGVSSARNLGLDNAKGKWIAFVDSDDMVKDLYLLNMISHANKYKVDLVISYAEIQFLNGRKVKEKYPSNLVEDDFSTLFLNNELYWHTSPWSKLFKANMCSELRFIEGMHIGEDLVFLYSYMLKCKSIFVSSDTDYIYNYENQGSLTKRVNTLEAELFSLEKISNIVFELMEKKHLKTNKVKDKLDWIISSSIWRVLNSLYNNSQITSNERVMLIKKMRVDKYIKNVSPSTLKENFLIILLRYKFFKLYDIIRSVNVKLVVK